MSLHFFNQVTALDLFTSSGYLTIEAPVGVQRRRCLPTEAKSPQN